MTPAVLILIGVVIGIIVGYTLALTVNYVEYWRGYRAPVELDEQLEAFRRLQDSRIPLTQELVDDDYNPVAPSGYYDEANRWHRL